MAVINATFLLLTLLAIVLSAVTYNRLLTAIPQAIPVSMQPDSTGGCVSTMFNTGGQQYRKVCGRAIGYQYGSSDAFGAISVSRTINEVYVDGLSITYGIPCQYIWTYAAAVREQPSTDANCPCSNYPGASPPSFLGDNWYCESGNPNFKLEVR